MRMPTWIEDVADALAFLLERRGEGTVHYSAERGGTRYESALEVGRILGMSTGHISPSEGPVARGAQRPSNSQLATSHIRALGYRRFTDFADVVRHVVARVG